MITFTDIPATGQQPARARLVGLGIGHVPGACVLRDWTFISMANTKRPSRHVFGVSM